MKTLDLHGVRHHQAEMMTEDFVLTNELPIKIVTGNSFAMKQIVQSILKKHDLHFELESHWNLGSITVFESKF